MDTALEFAKDCNNMNWPTAFMWVGLAAAAAFAIYAFCKYS